MHARACSAPGMLRCFGCLILASIQGHSRSLSLVRMLDSVGRVLPSKQRCNEKKKFTSCSVTRCRSPRRAVNFGAARATFLGRGDASTQKKTMINSVGTSVSGPRIQDNGAMELCRQIRFHLRTIIHSTIHCGQGVLGESAQRSGPVIRVLCGSHASAGDTSNKKGWLFIGPQVSIPELLAGLLLAFLFSSSFLFSFSPSWLKTFSLSAR